MVAGGLVNSTIREGLPISVPLGCDLNEVREQAKRVSEGNFPKPG